MNQNAKSTIRQVKTLSESYTLVDISIPETSDIQAGYSIEIDGVHYEIMSISHHSNTLQLLTNIPPETLKPGNTALLQIIEQPFAPAHAEYPLLLIGEDMGIAPVICAAQQLRQKYKGRLAALLGFHEQLPFRPAPSRMMLPSLPPHVIGAVPLLEEWNIASRIAHTEMTPGCYEGSVLELLRAWLQGLNDGEQIEILACTSQETTKGIKALAEEYHLPCRIRIC